MSLLRFLLENDWGDICAANQEENEKALTTEGLIVGRYTFIDETELYIIAGRDNGKHEIELKLLEEL